MKKWIAAVGAVLLMGSATAEASQTHVAAENDSLWSVGVEYGVSVLELQEVNNITDGAINQGETLTVPAGISAEEEELLGRLVEAEAQGEPFEGKVAVATVVLNRVDSDEFPDTISDVIYEVSPTGNYSFSPVQDGAINQSATAESQQAVKEALAFSGQGNGSLFFYNPETASNHWIGTQETTTTIGKHVFAK
ncbi:cell wall hydrolase [Alteribacillus sp. HJP-4]|uniref:cell wall hydrolase n=1 Tax=Alteribacillus sp. HJP-4 TaxID=2775394 RepID=UPI0035CCE711